MSCELCNETGWMQREGGGVIDCACRLERKRLQVMERAGIPERYRSKTFEGYDATANRSAAAGLHQAVRFVDEWPTNRHLGMLFTGPVGVGKTHLECTILLECSRRWGARVAFVDLPDLFTRIKATFDPGWQQTELEILRPLLEADILAIDEVGAARSTDWAFAMTEQIINTRYNQDKSTIVTTNFVNRPAGWVQPRGSATRPQLVGDDYAAIAAAPARQVETLGDRIGARMFSRLQEMCLLIEIDGQDQRAEAGRKRRS